MFNYTVQPGDTLASIASRYGTTAQAIMQANGITSINYLYPGQTLRIPAVGGIPLFPPSYPFPTPPLPSYPPTGGGLEQRVARLEQRVNTFDSAIDSLIERQSLLEQRVRRLEGR